MNDLTYNKTFNEWQQELDTELVKSAEGFVKIGYLLKVARDTDILKDSGYSGIVEFAKARYGLDKTQVSRFIHINDRFSEGGNSEELKDRYKGMGYAKLTIMLQLPDEINEELSPEFSKAEIEDVKKEFDEEKKISDLEVWAEGTAEETKELNELGQVLYQLLYDTPELFEKIYETSLAEDELTDILAPSGDMIYSVRIQGVGRIMMSIKTELGRITLTNTRSMEKEVYDVEDLVAAAIEVYSRVSPELENAKASYEKMFNEPFPEKQEVAPVQQEKAAVKKEKKVQKAKVEKPVHRQEKTESEDEQIPGQDSVMNHPEYMPENSNIPGSKEGISEPETNTEQENVSETEEVAEKETVEMPPDATNTECEDTSDNIASFMECWGTICEANRKITRFIEDYSTSDITPDNMRIEVARINAVTLAKELEHLKAL